MVSPSEGNEARRDGRQGVAAPHSRVEAGERTLPDPGERRGRRVVDRGWHHAKDIVPFHFFQAQRKLNRRFGALSPLVHSEIGSFSSAGLSHQ